MLDTEPPHKTETFPEQSVNANFNAVPLDNSKATSWHWRQLALGNYSSWKIKWMPNLITGMANKTYLLLLLEVGTHGAESSDWAWFPGKTLSHQGWQVSSSSQTLSRRGARCCPTCFLPMKPSIQVPWHPLALTWPRRDCKHMWWHWHSREEIGFSMASLEIVCLSCACTLTMTVEKSQTWLKKHRSGV